MQLAGLIPKLGTHSENIYVYVTHPHRERGKDTHENRSYRICKTSCGRFLVKEEADHRYVSEEVVTGGCVR